MGASMKDREGERAHHQRCTGRCCYCPSTFCNRNGAGRSEINSPWSKSNKQLSLAVHCDQLCTIHGGREPCTCCPFAAISQGFSRLVPPVRRPAVPSSRSSAGACAMSRKLQHAHGIMQRQCWLSCAGGTAGSLTPGAAQPAGSRRHRGCTTAPRNNAPRYIAPGSSTSNTSLERSRCRCEAAGSKYCVVRGHVTHQRRGISRRVLGSGCINSRVRICCCATGTGLGWWALLLLLW